MESLELIAQLGIRSPADGIVTELVPLLAPGRGEHP